MFVAEALGSSNSVGRSEFPLPGIAYSSAGGAQWGALHQIVSLAFTRGARVDFKIGPDLVRDTFHVTTIITARFLATLALCLLDCELS